jgi:hypothetical protein
MMGLNLRYVYVEWMVNNENRGCREKPIPICQFQEHIPQVSVEVTISIKKVPIILSKHVN